MDKILEMDHQTIMVLIQVMAKMVTLMELTAVQEIVKVHLIPVQALEVEIVLNQVVLM